MISCMKFREAPAAIRLQPEKGLHYFSVTSIDKQGLESDQSETVQNWLSRMFILPAVISYSGSLRLCPDNTGLNFGRKWLANGTNFSLAFGMLAATAPSVTSFNDFPSPATTSVGALIACKGQHCGRLA